MATSVTANAARSWLFVPGDSPKKMEKALAGAADILILDLEDSVAKENKPAARETVTAFIAANSQQSQRLWVRVNPVQSSEILLDLVKIVAARPAGIMLPKANGRPHLEQLDHYLTALEAQAQLPERGIDVIVIATETAQSIFSIPSYAEGPRLTALTWGAEDLSADIGASTNRRADGAYEFTYELARSLCLVGAAAARVAPIESIHGDFRDDAGLTDVATAAAKAGFTGMMAIHPAQVDAINRAFSPNAADVATAREIVDLFAANPGAGTLGYKGAMYDLPHLVRAQTVLARAARK